MTRSKSVASIRLSVYNKDYEVYSKTNDPEAKYDIVVKHLKSILKTLSTYEQRCKHCESIKPAWENSNFVDIEIKVTDNWYCSECGGANKNDETKRKTNRNTGWSHR